HSRWAYWSLAGSWFPRPEFPSADGTDGPAITSDFYQTWIDAYGNVDPAEADARFYQKNQLVPDELQDLTGLSPLNDENHYYCMASADFEIDRGIIRGVIWGPRKDDNGSFYSCDENYRIYPVKQTKGNGPDKDVGYVNHKMEVDFTNEGRLHSKGYRVSKYQFSHSSPNGNNYSSVDLVLMRYAEIFLMRAEAKLRKGDSAGALDDVNTVRTSRTAREPIPARLSSIDLEILYRERGFELYWEGFRRGDQIRFGHYEDSWTEKTDNDPHHRLFPIPQNAIDGASNVENYLIQNAGY
nr:RagB/SusD family nutrient uptake outer membrane protein [Flammeovirgaceae bacterium]